MLVDSPFCLITEEYFLLNQVSPTHKFNVTTWLQILQNSVKFLLLPQNFCPDNLIYRNAQPLSPHGRLLDIWLIRSWKYVLNIVSLWIQVKCFGAGIYFSKSDNGNLKNVWNLFKVNNKNDIVQGVFIV